MENEEIKYNTNEKEFKGNKNKKFDLKYLVEKENLQTPLFGKNFVANNKDKCYIIIDNIDCELKRNHKFSKIGEHIVTLVITDDNINFIKMFSNYSFSNITGGFDTEFNPYLIDISGLENLDVSQCTDLHGMFNGCKNIKNFECLKNWNVSNCENFEGIFAYCNMTDVNFLSSWKVDKAIDLGGIFYGCEKLSNLEGIKNWNVGRAKCFRDAFNNCKGLTDVNVLQNWNMSKANAINGMFCHCKNLVNVESLFKWKLNSGIRKVNIFWDCGKLKNVPSNLDGNNCQIY